MFEIDNFAAGIIPNAAWSGFRNVAAMDWSNLRVDPQGFLVNRSGHHALYTARSVFQVFAHKSLVFAIVEDRLQWGRAGGVGTEIQLIDFQPRFDVDVSSYYHFQVIETADAEFILLSNGTGDPENGTGGPYVISLDGVFDAEEPQDPTAEQFYLKKPNPGVLVSRTTPNEDAVDEADYHEDNEVLIYVQAVRTVEPQEGVPFIRDFRDPDEELPVLAPVIGVSDVTSVLGSTEETVFELTFSTDTLPSNDEIPITEVDGEDVSDYLIVDTSQTPDAVKTQGGEYIWRLLAGTFHVEISNFSSNRRNVTAYFEVNDGDGWVEVTRQRRTLSASVSDDRSTEFDFSFKDLALNKISQNTVIKFRVRATDGDVQLSENPSIKLQANSAFEILTTSLETLRSAQDLDAGDDLNLYNIPYTEMRIQLSLPTGSDADYVDIYRSRRRDPPDPYRDDYFLMARVPYENEAINLLFPASDDVLIDFWEDELPEQGELVAWQYAESDEYRIYAAGPNDNQLYLSNFDGISERRYLNLTDSITLPTQGEQITGIKFLEDNYLAVYTPHRILLVFTDPAPELIRIQGRYSQGPRDEAVGCVAPLSLVEVDEYHFFLSPNKRVYRFGGRRPTWASDKVQPLLEPLALPDYNIDGTQISDAVAVAYKGSYYLSFPSLEVEALHFVIWKGEKLEWKGDDLEWKPNFLKPNSTLIYDIDRDKWYRDGFGVESFSKDLNDRVYGVVEGSLFSLYTDDDTDEEMAWEWHSNYLMMPPRTNIFNVTVKTQKAVDITVTVRTEEGEQTRELSAQDKNDYWGQYAGFNLRGRTARLSISGVGSTIIDRISINEEVR